MRGYDLLTTNIFNQAVISSGLNLGEQGALLSQLNCSCFLLCTDTEQAVGLYEQLKALGKQAEILLDFNKSFTLSTYTNQDDRFSLLNILYKMSKGKSIIITTSHALLSHAISPDRFKRNILNLSLAETINISLLEKQLTFIGYKKVDIISEKGQYSKRGDILDIFPINFDTPLRFDFFDTEIEKIYSFDLITYDKLDNHQTVEIIPARLMLFEKHELATIISNINKIKDGSNILYEIIALLESNQDISLEFLSPFTEEILPLYEFNNNQLICINNELVISSVYDKYREQLIEKSNKLFKQNNLINLYSANYKNLNEIYKLYEKNLVFFEFNKNSLGLTSKLDELKIKNISEDFESVSLTNYLYRLDALQLELAKYTDKQLYLCLENENTLSAIKKLFTERNISFSTNKNSKGIILTTLPTPYNICFANEEKWYIGASNFAHKKNIVTSSKITIKYLPKAGEYVVHSIHGIGKCDGIVNVNAGGTEKEFFKLIYRGGDVLYVPTENVDCLSLYLADSNNVALNKLGGKDFSTQKEKVQKSIEEMGEELLALYARRKSAHGYKYDEDDYLFTEFENAFEYTETPDQLSAINDIKQDMHSGKVMDRLICGDVGYGKTEVAMRALFKTVEAGKQVAILAPTTILSMQHYMSTISRTKKFGVKVDMLNRFVSTKEQKAIIENLKNGKTNVVCGTHRLLSKDVSFNDLGLLVLDEEQRFGVKAKEQIKQLKNNINVLTLSATPIPRTLNMAMTSIRDISIINTPPKDRLAVKTYVLAYNDEIISSAIDDELIRGGQVLVVYNNIDRIYTLCEHLKKIVSNKNAVFDVAHGQMSEVALENAIKRLYEKQVNVFVSTTLIENGIDLPKANTLIVIDSDRLGLSQMYQLRGRVGRNNEQAYAYFTYSKDKSLTEEASSRLEAIAENTELGSGFKIAMRDMTIRGAGELLGKTQHGHMIKIGYDMYTKLLIETIKKLKGEKVETEKDIKLDIAISSKIPTSFTDDETERLKIYAKISNISSVETERIVVNELLNIYGKVPYEILQLCLVALIKSLAIRQNIKQLTITKTNMSMTYYSDTNLSELMKKVNKYKKFAFQNTALPTIKLNPVEFSVQTAQGYILNFLKDK